MPILSLRVEKRKTLNKLNGEKICPLRKQKMKEFVIFEY